MSRTSIRFCLVLYSAVMIFTGLSRAYAQDLLVNDFEGPDYGQWQVQGAAFGQGPAKGALPGQMAVEGFEGKRLVNSFAGGDGSTGTLTSPAFEIQRDYLNFLIGGGNHPGETCMELLVDNQVQRTATGPNNQPGGSERLDWSFWDVKEFRGKEVILRIVDRSTGGWGHINVDHIYQSDQKAKSRFIDVTRQLQVEGQLLLIPIDDQATPQKLQIWNGETLVHQLDANLAAGDADWWAFLDVSELKGQSIEIRGWHLPSDSQGLKAIRTADQLPAEGNLYTEKLRPQLRFSQKRGWNNDPNGMVYSDGQYHFFWQSNPVGWNWNNMYWGHAVSNDLVHWEEKPHALKPYVMAQGMCFSGGGTLDVNNTGGWQVGDQPVMVLGFTDTGAGEAIVISRDGGVTFEAIDSNPVVKHTGRDPKLFWYDYQEQDKSLDELAKERGGHWVMAVYDEAPENGQNISFYISNDLQQWALASRIGGFFECPEIFELPVGETDQRFWVMFAADAQYVLGSFDGRTFRPDHEGKQRVHYGDFYASQCFTHAPDGRVLQVGWARINTPGMPFNQAFSLPLELTLQETKEGPRLFAKPAEELNNLRSAPIAIERKTIDQNGLEVPVEFSSDKTICDLELEIEMGSAENLKLQFGENELTIDTRKGKIDEVPYALEQGLLKLRVVVDRPMFELVVSEGAGYLTRPRRDGGEPVKAVRLWTDAGTAKLKSFKLYPLNSIWRQAEK